MEWCIFGWRRGEAAQRVTQQYQHVVSNLRFSEEPILYSGVMRAVVPEAREARKVQSNAVNGE